MKIYSLYSKSLGRYNMPFFAENDAESVSIVSKMVTAQNDPSLICALDDLELRSVAHFNPAAESVTEVVWGDAPGCCVVMVDLHKNLPLPPTIKERIDKYYGGSANA